MDMPDSIRDPSNAKQQLFRQHSAPRASQARIACTTSKAMCENEPICKCCRKKSIHCNRGSYALSELNDFVYDKFVSETPASIFHIPHIVVQTSPRDGSDYIVGTTTPPTSLQTNLNVSSTRSNNMVKHHIIEIKLQKAQLLISAHRNCFNHCLLRWSMST